MKVDQKNIPAGTRFLYRGFMRTSPCEDFMVEWSPSGKYAHLKKQGWMSSEDVFRFELLEILPSKEEKNLDEEMCPNCGPHLIKKIQEENA